MDLFLTFGGRVEHFQKVKQLCHPSVIIMTSITFIIEALLLLLGALNSGGVVPPNNHCNIRNLAMAIDFKIPKEKASSSFLIVIYSLSEFVDIEIKVLLG